MAIATIMLLLASSAFACHISTTTTTIPYCNWNYRNNWCRPTSTSTTTTSTTTSSSTTTTITIANTSTTTILFNSTTTTIQPTNITTSSDNQGSSGFSTSGLPCPFCAQAFNRAFGGNLTIKWWNWYTNSVWILYPNDTDVNTRMPLKLS